MLNRLTYPRFGCRWLSCADVVDAGERKRTYTNFYGRPPAVLKTAGLPSTAVHGRPLEFDRGPSDSRIVRPRPPVSVELAVFLAVSHRTGWGLLSHGSGFDSLREHQHVTDQHALHAATALAPGGPIGPKD